MFDANRKFEVHVIDENVFLIYGEAETGKSTFIRALRNDKVLVYENSVPERFEKDFIYVIVTNDKVVRDRYLKYLPITDGVIKRWVNIENKLKN